MHCSMRHRTDGHRGHSWRYPVQTYSRRHLIGLSLSFQFWDFFLVCLNSPPCVSYVVEGPFRTSLLCYFCHIPKLNKFFFTKERTNIFFWTVRSFELFFFFCLLVRFLLLLIVSQVTRVNGDSCKTTLRKVCRKHNSES